MFSRGIFETLPLNVVTVPPANGLPLPAAGLLLLGREFGPDGLWEFGGSCWWSIDGKTAAGC